MGDAEREDSCAEGMESVNLDGSEELEEEELVPKRGEEKL